MDINLETLTLAALLTTAGATVVATIVSGFVAITKRIVPQITGHEIQVVAVTSAVIVLLMAFEAISTQTMTVGVPLLLAVLFGWYGVTRLAMSLYDDVTGQPNSLRTPK